MHKTWEYGDEIDHGNKSSMLTHQMKTFFYEMRLAAKELFVNPNLGDLSILEVGSSPCKGLVESNEFAGAQFEHFWC